MLIKEGVDISLLKPEIRKKLNKIQKGLAENGLELIITSTYEGTHSAGSLHYANWAIDIRVPKIDKHFWRDRLANVLGDNFDVVLEADHIHIEYDPPI